MQNITLTEKQIPITLQSFYYYLKAEHLQENTAREHIKNIERFTAWAKEQNLVNIEQINYNELLGYVQNLRSKELSIPTINIRLNSIRKYYQHLKEEGKAESNPAKRIFIKGTIKRVVQNPLTWQQLENLFNQYQQYIAEKNTTYAPHKLADQKYIAALSLMIWQGVHSGEMEKMEKQHINLKEGTIYIAGTRRSKGRELKLHSMQVIPLHTYLNSLPETQTKLFATTTHNLTIRLCGQLSGINPQVKNAYHIRASVILHWLKMYDKRQVQYMIGHKWISSTEHYQVQELEGLTDLLKKHHPFS